MAGKQLFADGNDVGKAVYWKRKSKGAGAITQTPDLNLPVDPASAIIPSGLVNSRVQELGGNSESNGESMIETLKKQRRSIIQPARSAALRMAAPAGHNENLKPELPGSGAARGSS